MTSFKELAVRDSCFRPGSTLCPGCMEAVAFQNLGRATDNGVKTVFTIGTSCAEVSTLFFPDVVAWGRGDGPPDAYAKSFAILHNVFESAPTLGEAVRDVADALGRLGALHEPVQVVSASGDGGALAIGLRALLHTIHRGARITVIVLVNEIFANTGFQVSPASTPFADTSTTPTGPGHPGNMQPPLDYLHLCIAAGAAMVAQVSPAHPKLFLNTLEKALALESGTAVIFVPAPCISGWKFNDGETIELATLGARSGVFPVFTWQRGTGGSVKDCPLEAEKRPPVESFLGRQRRFHHLVQAAADGEGYTAKPGREEDLARMRAWVQGNVERLYQLATLK